MTAPVGRGDDADALGERGQRTFAVGVEEAFGEEAGFELFEGELERAGAARLHGFGDELKLAAALVDGDAAAHQHGEAIGRTKAEERGLTTEEDNGKLGFAVLEGEVDVAGGCGAAVRDLSLDPEIGVGGLDLLANVGDEARTVQMRRSEGGWRGGGLGSCGGETEDRRARARRRDPMDSRIKGQALPEKKRSQPVWMLDGGSVDDRFRRTKLCPPGAKARKGRLIVFLLTHTPESSIARGHKPGSCTG